MSGDLDFPDDAPHKPTLADANNPVAVRLFTNSRAAAEREIASAYISDHTGECRALCANLKPEIFTDKQARDLFKVFTRAGGINGYSWEQVAQKAYLTKEQYRRIEKLDPNGERLGANLAAVREKFVETRVSSAKTAISAPKPDLKSAISDLREADSVTAPTESRFIAHPIADFGYPDGDDPSVLIGADDYLGRGGGMLFVSHAGAGKSSFTYDMMMAYAIGRPWMGIRCNGPLKSLIIQAEDSDRYVGKIAASFDHAMSLTAEERVLLRKNCVTVRMKGISGPKFFEELRLLTTAHQPDLVVINPIYIYAEGDISRSEFAQPFLLGLDAVNRDEKFGYILVHHTGKPAARNLKGDRPDLDDWETVYMGFGSSYLANWPRCSALLEPVPKTPGRYNLKLGKAGINAGVTRQVEQGVTMRHEPVTRIAIKHCTDRLLVNGVSRPVIFWQPDTDAPAATSSSQRNAGAPTKFSFADYITCVPATAAEALSHKDIFQRAQARGEEKISDSSFRRMFKQAEDAGQITCIDKGRGGFRYHLTHRQD